MRRWGFVFVLVIGFAIASLVAGVNVAHTSTLRRTASSLQEQVSSLRSNLADATKKLASASKRADSADEDLATLQAKYNDLESDYSSALFGNTQDSLDALSWRALQAFLPVTAICLDYSYSNSQHASGTCSWHGGVGVWVHHPGG